MVRRMSFARYMREIEKGPNTRIWAFVGEEKALIDMASARLLQEINLPTRRITSKFTPMNVFHTMGDLDLMADKWAVVLDGVKKIDKLDAFKKGMSDSLGQNYLILLGENLDSDIQEWAGQFGKVVNCEKVDNRKDLLDVMGRIFGDQGIRLTTGAVPAVLNLTGSSVGAMKNAAGLLRAYYGADGRVLDLDDWQIKEVVPSLNYEDVFAVVNEILYRRRNQALAYYQKLKERSDVQYLFLDRVLAIFRDLWVISRVGELSPDQQSEMGIDQRTYAKIKSLNPPSEEALARIYRVVLEIYQHSKSAADEDFVVEAMLIYIDKILNGDNVGPFPLTIRNAKISPARPSEQHLR